MGTLPPRTVLYKPIGQAEPQHFRACIAVVTRPLHHRRTCAAIHHSILNSNDLRETSKDLNEESIVERIEEEEIVVRGLNENRGKELERLVKVME